MNPRRDTFVYAGHVQPPPVDEARRAAYLDTLDPSSWRPSGSGLGSRNTC